MKKLKQNITVVKDYLLTYLFIDETANHVNFMQSMLVSYSVILALYRMIKEKCQNIYF